MDSTQCSAEIVNLIDISLGDYKEMGGPGSGHHGHKGRKGKRGGSLPSKAGGVLASQVVRRGEELGISIRSATPTEGNRFDAKSDTVYWDGKHDVSLYHEMGHGIMTKIGAEKDYSLVRGDELGQHLYTTYKDHLISLVRRHVKETHLANKAVVELQGKKTIGLGFGRSITTNSQMGREFWIRLFRDSMTKDSPKIGKRQLLDDYSLNNASEFWADIIALHGLGKETGFNSELKSLGLKS